jgi:Family of unknown function (DUF5681)
MDTPEPSVRDPGEEAPRRRGRPFKPGSSGNPNGRPQGARNKATLDGEVEALLRKVIEKALAGDTAALRLCLDRVLPARRERLVTLVLPKIETAKDGCAASAAILAACANGELSTGEAAEFMGLVAAHLRVLETSHGCGAGRIARAWKRSPRRG